MNLRKYLYILFFIPLVAFTMHKYYISLCEIEHNEEQNTLQIIVGLFIDDLEYTLNKNHKKTLNLATKQEIENIDEYYQSYLNKHFKITVNNSLKPYIYIGKEYDDDIVRFYLEIANIEKIKSIEIINNLLFKDFEDQQNIVKIKVNRIHKTFYLTTKNDKGLLNF